jgi:LPXTG-motif cell wall-anchored protein
MYGAGRAAAVGAAATGVAAAEGALPVTGIALGVYVAVGLGLILIGLVLRRKANSNIETR